MDYGKFKYETALKERESRKNQTHTIVKEIKLRPKIDPHDYGTKKGHVERFLKAGDKVKVTIMFRGREQSRPELGFRLLQKLADDVTELGFVESQPKQDGRNMIMVIGPHRRPPERKVEAKPAPESAPEPAQPGSVPSPRGETPVPVPADAAEVAAETPAPAPTDTERFTPATGRGRGGPARWCGAVPRGNAAPRVARN
jgi:translation initiation factor IF-3